MDITQQVIEAINAWIQSLATHLLRPALGAAGQLLFQTPQYDSMPEVQQAWATIRDVSDSLLVLAVIAVGLLVMSSGVFETHYTAKLLIPRLALAAILSNTSLAICGALITLDNALVHGLLGADPGASTWSQLTTGLSSPAAGDQVITSLVALAAATLAVLLVVVYIGRDLLLLLATVLAPLALATQAVPHADEIARLWWRGYLGTLFLQVVQAVLISVGAQIVSHANWLGSASSSLINGLVLVTLLYLNLRLPFVAYKWAFRQSLSSHPAVRKIVFAAKAAAAAAVA